MPDDRIVSTEVYEAMPANEAVSTVTFTDEGGATVLTILVQHANRELRDGHLASGMEDGMNEALDLLDEIAGEADHETSRS